MSDLLKRMKHWLQYPRLSSGEKLMAEAVTELERLQKIITDHLDHTADGVLVCEHEGPLYCPYCGGELVADFWCCYCWNCRKPDEFGQPLLPLSYGLVLAHRPQSKE